MNNNISLNEFFLNVSSQLANLSQTFLKFTHSGATNISIASSNGSGKKKKKKQVQDPNAPKKPLSSYLQFCIQRQPEVKQKNPQATFSEVSKIIGQEWQNMSQEKKKKWIDKEEGQKKEYLIQLAEYNKKNGLPAPFQSTGSASNSKTQKKAEVKVSEKSDKQIISDCSETDEDDEDSSSEVNNKKNNQYNAKYSNSTNSKNQNLSGVKRVNQVTKREYSESNSDYSSSDSDEPVQQKKKKN